jgi:hypothetical protein
MNILSEFLNIFSLSFKVIIDSPPGKSFNYGPATIEEIFAGTDVRISTDGHKYLGGHIGSEQGKNEYVQSLLESWSNQLRVLSDIAKYEPQAAYTAFL